MMDVAKIASELLEISSEQRLEIIQQLSEESCSLSVLSKKLDSTTPEVHRNLSRLLHSKMIEKNPNGEYSLSAYGQMLFDNVLSTILFLSKNKDLFENHYLKNIPSKFLKRIGDLESSKKINGFVKVLEKWKQIHENSEKFIYNILWEVPYSSDILDIISKKLKQNVLINSIFAENAIISDEREKLYKKHGFQKSVDSGNLVRRMSKKIPVVILLNEKEASVIFLNNENEVDMSMMFYSMDSKFHEWCLDIFKHEWEHASSFFETKLR